MLLLLISDRSVYGAFSNVIPGLLMLMRSGNTKIKSVYVCVCWEGLAEEKETFVLGEQESRYAAGIVFRG